MFDFNNTFSGSPYNLPANPMWASHANSPGMNYNNPQPRIPYNPAAHPMPIGIHSMAGYGGYGMMPPPPAFIGRPEGHPQPLPPPQPPQQQQLIQPQQGALNSFMPNSAPPVA